MERSVDFSRRRSMLCGGCGHRFVVDLDWIERWEQGGDVCPGCGLTCEHEDAPRVTVRSDDPALQDDLVAVFFWYHTSTKADWPTRNFDPAAELTPQTRRRMGGNVWVAGWAERQQAKALHVGTYEAAIQNMFRRMRDQPDWDGQFYLYRVHLKPSVSVRQGWLVDPGNWLGDVVLDEVCPPGVDVTRYLNYHEDAGGLSLALGRDGIAGVQRVKVPLPAKAVEGVHWVTEAVAALESVPDVLVPATGKLRRFLPPSSLRTDLARDLLDGLAGRLPVNLRGQFTSSAAFARGVDPALWARRARSLTDLIVDPGRMMAALDEAEHRSP